METWNTPSDETVLISLLAIGANPNNRNIIKTMYNWPRTVGEYGGYSVVNSYTGSLRTYISAHCFFDFQKLGMDNPFWTDSTQPPVPVNWWINSVNATHANRQFCIDNAGDFASYGVDSWGITDCGIGMLGAAPCEYNSGTPYHNGTIAPFGAISCMPFMRNSEQESLDTNLGFRALRHYYQKYYHHLWGTYGPKDFFGYNNGFSDIYIGIDVGAQVLMIENYRSGVVWDNFMKNEKVRAAIGRVFGNSPSDPSIIYVDKDNLNDPGQDGSMNHPFGTIQNGIDAATSGCSINVAEGTYNETVTLNKSGVTLSADKSFYGERTCIIQGTGEVPTIYCENISGAQTLIRGFKIYGYYGVRCAGTVSSLAIDDNFIQVAITGGPQVSYGYGVYLDDGASAKVTNNYFTYCGRAVHGNGNNTVDVIGNSMIFCRGGDCGLSLTSGTALIKNNHIDNSWCGTIGLYANTHADLINNTMGGSSWNSPAGIIIRNSTATLRNNIISGAVYSSGTVGAGLDISDSVVNLYNNLFCYNAVPAGYGRGAAIYAVNSDLVTRNNIFYDNGAGLETVYFSGLGECDFSYNDFWRDASSAQTFGVTPGPGNISSDPLFDMNVSPYYYLLSNSPCINAGDPDPAFNDKDGTRNDMGIYGGPNALD